MATLTFATLLALLTWTTLSPGPHGANTSSGETYQSVQTDAEGRLVVTTSDGRTIAIPKAADQRSFGAAVVSADRTAVGAPALYPNCCTSYDLPLELVIYSRGKVHRFRGIGFPIFHWHFADGGTQVAFGQEPAHFGCAIHYELREIDSEHLIDEVVVPQPCAGSAPAAPVKVPDWVRALNRSRDRAR